ncbi:MAG: tail fiber domain-containing protein [Planctomycetota bacterium]
MAVLLGVPGATAGTNPPGTAITYQGELTQNFLPVNDVCNFLVTLYDGDCDAGGLPLGDPVLVPTVPVIDGVFTFQVDFGPDLFTGTERWLAIEVSCPAGQPFVALSPCQKITPAPLALALPGLWTQQNTTSPNVIGGWSGNIVAEAVTGATISGGGNGADPNSVMDNFGTVGGGVGNSAVGEQSTVGGGALNSADGTSATIGGGITNLANGANATIGGGNGNVTMNSGATIGGGVQNTATGGKSTVGGGETNSASALFSTVGGGKSNSVSALYSTVGGGLGNSAILESATVGGGANNSAEGVSSTVGGGIDNLANGANATVGGGSGNVTMNSIATIGGGLQNSATGRASTVGGGESNSTSLQHATVGGGYLNSAGGEKSTVGGGESNSASALYSTVGGGFDNDVSGQNATVPGGALNMAVGITSFAAGSRAEALHNGAFVWSDRTGDPLQSTKNNQFSVRSAGGVKMYTNADLSTGVKLGSGGIAWNSVSDRNVKENFEAVDPREVLERLASIPIETWSVKGQEQPVRHMGPMAQDFRAAYGLGTDDKHISTVDADGVALAAAKGLYGLVQEKDAEIVELRARLSALEALVAKLASQQEGGTK